MTVEQRADNAAAQHASESVLPDLRREARDNFIVARQATNVQALLTKRYFRGRLKRGSVSLAIRLNSASIAASFASMFPRTTKAHGPGSPSSSKSSTTAAACTPACRSNTPSTSTGETHCPLDLKQSSLRPM